MIKKYTLFIAIFSTFLTAASAQINIIPQPYQVEIKKGNIEINKKTSVSLPKGEEWQYVYKALNNRFVSAAGFSLSTKGSANNQIIINKVTKPSLGTEGYTINTSDKNIIIEANNAKGAFYAVQTILQLLPEAIFSDKIVSDIKWHIPKISIIDYPRFPYRGMHLDVARHFFDKEFVKKYIDLLALHKQNNFHWHLTDDQGWRIEIKKYPKLTEVSSKRNLNDPNDIQANGFYTQEDIKEVVAYAKEKFINVIPEIEMPGHATAALAAYPSLAVDTNRTYKVVTTWGVFNDIFAPRESTFIFLQNVLEEVMSLFPSKYIHIGGDECRKTQWQNSSEVKQIMTENGLNTFDEVQSYFIHRIDSFVASKGRTIIGWNEILDGGLSPNATVQSWQGTMGGRTAALQGHDAIMSPEECCYLNFFQGPVGVGPKGYWKSIPLKQTYNFNPIPLGLTPEQEKHIIGIQGNAWAEYMNNSRKVEYDVFPRALAVAEIGWSDKKDISYAQFLDRLYPHLKRLDYLDVNYYGAPINHQFEYIFEGKQPVDSLPQNVKYKP